MGDLKVGESFEDRVYIVDSSGAAKTGLAPSCTIIDESGNRTAGTVAEMASGWYKVTDFTPDAAGTWCLEWAVAGTYVIQYPNKLFKVGGGTLSDIETELTFQQKPEVFIEQNLTQNVWVTVLDTQTNVRLIGITILPATTGETIEWRIIIDGLTITPFATALTANTKGFGYLNHGWDALFCRLTTTEPLPRPPFIIEGRSVKVEVRKTTAAGSDLIKIRLIWAQR